VTVTFVVAISVLLGLMLFFYNEVRRWPGPPRWGRTPKWPKRIRVTLAAIPLLLGGVAFWAILIEPGRLVVRHETIHVNGWPKELDGLSVATISDIHAGAPFIDEQKLRLIVERTNQLQPDLVVILGDYMTSDGWMRHEMEPEEFAPMLKGFRAPLGVYSVLGNHDWWYSGQRVGQRVRRALEANEIKVLDEEVVELKTRGTSLWLVGLADLWTQPQHIEDTFAKVPETAPAIALAHNPDIFPRLPKRVQLLIAGHTHGGQVKFPLIGRPIESSHVGGHYAAGHVFENDHHMFVTTGIGTSILPVRFGVPPEIVLLTLKSP
jgi:predicted MPP superfamily phosphohydrolase